MKLNLCVDLFGCPNQCRHCWLGHLPHRAMEADADERIVRYFKPYFEKIAFYSWFREPDFTDRYEERWERDLSLSVNTRPERFELAGFYRLCRDERYVDFLSRVGVKTVQLTFFGMEEMTDAYVGRRGAFRELMIAAERLMAHGINPRYQVFINAENRDDVIRLLPFLKRHHDDRSALPFSFFVHEGSCDGENQKLYDRRIDKEDIPEELRPYHLDFEGLSTEEACCACLQNDPTSYVPHNEEEITLYITSDYSVYYHFTHLTENWKVGNLLEESASSLVRRIKEENTFALNAARKISLSRLVALYGDPTSHKAFYLEDYKSYLLNRHIESLTR